MDFDIDGLLLSVLCAILTVFVLSCVFEVSGWLGILAIFILAVAILLLLGIL